MFAVARGSVISGEHLKKSGPWRNSFREGFLIFIEFVYVLIRINAIIVESFLKIFVPQHEKSLAGEIALVTGSGHGIGQELVLRLVAEGCKVVGWDKSEEGNAETYKLLKEKGLGDRVKFYTCDVTKREDVLSLANRVEQEVGPISLLINNAGVMICKPLSSQTQLNIETQVNVNYLAHFWTLEAFLPKMKQRNVGHIVAVCSACGLVGLPNAVPYSSTKFAVRGLMETLREEMRTCEKNSSIKFTTVNPIGVETGLAKNRCRFPSVTGPLSVDEVTEAIIKAIKREVQEISVPSVVGNFDRFMRLLPTEVYQITRDFLDTGVVAE